MKEYPSARRDAVSKPGWLTASAPVPAPAPTAGKKRKSAALEVPPVVEIDDDDPRLCYVTDSCQLVRRKIKTFLDAGLMKVGEFQDAIGVSSPAYGRFMAMTGTHKGEGCDTYDKGWAFLRKRELQGLPITKAQAKKDPRFAAMFESGAGGDGPASKKAKTAKEAKKEAEALLDVAGIALPGEAEGHEISVYDTPDELRKKIRAFLKRDGITQAALCRAFAKQLPGGDDRTVYARSFSTFMGQKSVMGGNISAVFYAGYVFFEKLRLKQGKPKSAFRQEMEEIHGARGVDVEHNANGGIWVPADGYAYYDKYGQLKTGRHR
jgi:hypothetical protein